MAATLNDQDLRKLARLGAIARLKELEAEAQAIRKMFPGLKVTGEAPEEPTEAAAKPRKRKGGMSKEARRAQAERMRLYWAQRREAKAAAAAEGGENAETGKKTRGRKKAR